MKYPGRATLPQLMLVQFRMHSSHYRSKLNLVAQECTLLMKYETYLRTSLEVTTENSVLIKKGRTVL